MQYLYRPYFLLILAWKLDSLRLLRLRSLFYMPYPDLPGKNMPLRQGRLLSGRPGLSGLCKESFFKIKNKMKVLERLRHYTNVSTTEQSVILFSGILHDLKERGTLIPTFDIFIAAMAIENRMSLITLDNHFKIIKGLSCPILV